jgi:ABC-type multidrug transport system fused ATPase/permease subunit
MAPLGFLVYIIQSYFRKTSREMKRLEGVARSPIYSLFGEVLQGLPTIRAYDRTLEFRERMFQLVDFHGSNFFAFWAASRWLAVRLDFIGVCIVFVVTILAVGLAYSGSAVDTNTLGVAMVYALQLTGLLQWTVRVTIDTETNMTSVERLLTFAEIKPEASNDKVDTYKHFRVFLQGFDDPLKIQTSGEPSGGLLNHQQLLVAEKITNTAKWPYFGCIQISNLSMRYREGLSLVLQNVNLDVPGGAKVGVVGRFALISMLFLHQPAFITY